MTRRLVALALVALLAPLVVVTTPGQAVAKRPPAPAPAPYISYVFGELTGPSTFSFYVRVRGISGPSAYRVAAQGTYLDASHQPVMGPGPDGTPVTTGCGEFLDVLPNAGMSTWQTEPCVSEVPDGSAAMTVRATLVRQKGRTSIELDRVTGTADLPTAQGPWTVFYTTG